MQSRTTGWTPTCECYDERYWADFPQARSKRKAWQRRTSGDWWRRVKKRGVPFAWPIQECTVLDPFCGSGTTNLVAKQMGRNSIGIDLSEEYLGMAWKRIHNPEPEPKTVDVPGQMEMFAVAQ